MQQREYGREVALLVAARIQHLRTEQGWSLDELAQRSGLHRTSVGLIVRGERLLTIETASALTRALDVSLSAVVAHAEGQLRDLD